MARSFAIHVVLAAALCAPLACSQAAEDLIYDLCSDTTCTNAPACPLNPPTGGFACSLSDGAQCHYCTEKNNVDAHAYECTNDKWKRLNNIACK